jgi:sugar phosphate isomerase/epimerase
MTAARPKPTLAFSNRIGLTGTALVGYALDQGFHGVDWHLYSRAPERSLTGDDLRALEDLRRAGLELRFHLSPEVEMAHADAAVAARALEHLKLGVDIAARYGGHSASARQALPPASTYATVHLACNESPPGDLDWAAALDNLSALVAYGAARGVTVCLENLRRGWTSDPDRFLELVQRSGASVTFDLGHANSSSLSHRRLEFLDRVAPRVVNAHVYAYEQEHVGHLAPSDLSVLRPLLAALLATSCDWWLIELSDRAAMERTRALLVDFLD